MNINIVFSVVGAYLIGSVSPAYIYYKRVKGGDIRNAGDGNPGAANIYKLVGSTPAFVIALLDFCKGIIPLFVARQLGINDLNLIPVGIATVVGHDWSIFLGFRGGKGTLISLGVLAFYLPAETILAFAIWLFIHYGLKTRFIGSVITFSLILLFTYVISCTLVGEPLYYLFLPIAILLLFLVRMPGNIANFFKGLSRPK